MKMINSIPSTSIAPCGLNCLACSAYFNVSNPCPGCRAPEEEISRKSCRECLKKKCAYEKGLFWCFQCDEFPCLSIKKLNKRYLEKYNVNLIQNGLDAKSDMPAFLEAQKERFTCRECGGIIDQHHKRCSDCGKQIGRI